MYCSSKVYRKSTCKVKTDGSGLSWVMSSLNLYRPLCGIWKQCWCPVFAPLLGQVKAGAPIISRANFHCSLHLLQYYNMKLTSKKVYIITKQNIVINFFASLSTGFPYEFGSELGKTYLRIL